MTPDLKSEPGSMTSESMGGHSSSSTPEPGLSGSFSAVTHLSSPLVEGSPSVTNSTATNIPSIESLKQNRLVSISQQEEINRIPFHGQDA